MSVVSWYIRHSWAKNDAKRDAGLTTPEDILRYDNIAYGPDKMNLLDVYRPKQSSGKLPVIVNVHGGGWVYGDKELYQHYGMSLAQRGFIVVNFTYRLSPEHKFPAHVEDTNAVFSWVLTHGEEYDMDLNHIFATGDSAGGHILALYSCICTNPEYAATYPFRAPEGFVPKAIALNCGLYDMTLTKSGNGGDTSVLMRDVLPKKGKREELEWISPARYVTKNYPPSFIFTANEDFLQAQAPVMEKVLKEKGVLCRLAKYGDGENPQGHVFNVNVRNETGRKCNDDQCAWFRQFM